MEEAKADELFRLFTKVDAAAKQKKGLGYASGGGFESHDKKKAPNRHAVKDGAAGDAQSSGHDDAQGGSFMQSFVKEGKAKPQSAAAAAAQAKREAEDAALSRRSTANAVAAKLAAKAAELKLQRQHDRCSRMHGTMQLPCACHMQLGAEHQNGRAGSQGRGAEA